MGDYIALMDIEDNIYKDVEEYFLKKEWNTKIDIFIYITKQLLKVKKHHKELNPTNYKIFVSNMSNKIKNSEFLEKQYESLINYCLFYVNHNYTFHFDFINYATLEALMKFCRLNPDKINSIRAKIRKIKAENSKEYNKKLQELFINYKIIEDNDVKDFMKDKNNKNLSNIMNNALSINRELSIILENYIEEKIENSSLEDKSVYRKIKRLYISGLLELEENIDNINEILYNEKGIK